MPYNRTVVSSTGTHLSRFAPQVVLAMGGVGAIVGGTAAAARNIRRVKDARITREDAIKDTLREAAGAGLATATATVVVRAVGATGLLSLVGILAAATGAKYFWDAATAAPKPGTAPPPQPSETPPKKGKPART